jgi:hypothetical protein
MIYHFEDTFISESNGILHPEVLTKKFLGFGFRFWVWILSMDFGFGF